MSTSSTSPITTVQIPDIPPARGYEATATAEIRPRYEDIVQDGRVQLLSLAPGLGAVWAKLYSADKLTAFRTNGILPILRRMIVVGNDGPFSVHSKFQITGTWRIAREENGDRIFLDMWIEARAPIGLTLGPPPAKDAELAVIGRIYAEHILTKPFASSPAERKVTRIDAPGTGLPSIPEDTQSFLEAEALIAEHGLSSSNLEEGQGQRVEEHAFSAMHTDSNQHVNSLVYPRVFEELVVRRVMDRDRDRESKAHASLLSRAFEIRYRKPFFQGDRASIALNLDANMKAVGFVSSEHEYECEAELRDRDVVELDAIRGGRDERGARDDRRTRLIQILIHRCPYDVGMKRNARIAAAAVVLSVSGLLLWKSHAASGAPQLSQSQSPQSSSSNSNRPKVDIVFAVDTTGSMSGLLDGAKAKIWEIARKAQEGKPAPELRIGLVAYRDKNDDYVTKVVPLTSDLDSVYAKLTELKAGGGGDSPEHVLRGLDDAMDAQWSTDPNAVKLVYLVGDAPPHNDYSDGISLESVLAKAKRKDVHVSAIRCGNDSSTLSAWTEIAQKTDGEVASIEQSGGVVAVTTPYDAELARLNGQLARTEVHWGSRDEQREAAATLEANVNAPAAAQADRAGFYATRGAGGLAAPTKRDLTADPSKLDALGEGDLPPEMKSMSPTERAAFVETKKKEREQVLGKIAELNDKRSSHMKTAAPPKPAAFDSKVVDSLKKAGSKKGIAY